MKLSGKGAGRFLEAPDPGLAGALLHGRDESVVASRQRILIEALLGDDRSGVERLDPAAVRRDPETLVTSLRSRSFFDSRRVVLIERATDTVAPIIESALADTSSDDAFLLVTSRFLGAKSPLRRLFEQKANLASVIISADPPGRAEIVNRLEASGCRAGLTDEAHERLFSIAAEMDVSAFESFLDTLAIYSLDLEHPITPDDISALAPGSGELELDIFITAVANGHAEQIGPLLRRIMASGVTAVGLVLALQRHFRQLLLAAGVDGGPEAGLGRIRPPLWGARRDAMRAQLQRWRIERIEMAIRLLFDVDSRLRSEEQVPDLALVERCALRLALMARG